MPRRGLLLKLASFQGELDSSMLSFQMSAKGEGEKIFMETQEVASEIENATTIRHQFNPDTYGIFNVDCRREKKLTGGATQGIDTVERNGTIYGKFGFCPQRIFVGCKFSSSSFSFPCLFGYLLTMFMLVSKVFMLCKLNIFQWNNCTRVE